MKHERNLTLTESAFDREVLASGQPVVVDFWAAWCAPCHMIAPTIEQLAEEYVGSARVGTVDVDEEQELAERYGVRSIPTVLFFRDGRVVDRVVGVVSKQVLEHKLNALLPA